MRTTGGPAPDVSTCRDSVAATGTLKLWRSAVSASSATVRSQTIVPSGFGLVESDRRAERQHGPNDALVMLGDRRETGPQRRELARQPDTLPEAVPKCVGRVLGCGLSAARDGHGGLLPVEA